MAKKVIITRKAVKKGDKVSTGRIYKGNELIKFSTEILTAVEKKYYNDNLIVYNSTDKNGNNYNIIELKCRAIIISQLLKMPSKEITGIGLNPKEEKITQSVRIHPKKSRLLATDFITYNICDVTTINENHIIVISIFA